MAESTETERLRQATKVKEAAWDHLVEGQELQRLRWELLGQIADDAAWQYTTMRIDAVEESLREQGAPLWMSCILAVGMSLIPVSTLTGTFLTALTSSTKKLLTSADRKLLASARNIALREQDVPRALRGLSLWRQLPGEIRRTEELVEKFAKAWEPELSNILQDAVQGLGQTIGKQPFMQDAARKLSRTDAPVVVVRRALRQWISSYVRAEAVARKMRKDKIRDLFDIATSPDPQKEAKEKEEEAKTKEAAKKPNERKPVEELPKTNDAALEKLKELRDELADAIESSATIKAEDLWDLQLTIESMIWCATYDFSIRFDQFERVDPDGATIKGPATLIEAPLPDALWNRLIERYIDPDEGKSYKDAGYVDRLGTKEAPYLIEPKHRSTLTNPGTGGWGPKVRLSHYFSQILYPKLMNENRSFVDKYRAMKAP